MSEFAAREAAVDCKGGDGMEGSRRLTAPRAGWIALLALVPALFLEAAPARAVAPLPPDLVALEQQMAQLQANSERFSFQEEVSLGELLGQGIPLVFIVAGEGEASDSPPQAAFAGGILGLRQEQTRLIGDTVYRYQHAAAEIDGGRSWVRGQPSKQHAQGLDPGGVLENDQAGTQGTFSKLIEQLNGALAVRESGPVTVDDQRVVEFDATLDPTPLLAELKSQSKQPRRPLNSLLEIPSVGGSKNAKPAAPPTLELELFIAPSGLPVRARLTFTAEGATVAVRVDTLAINVPVHVAPPPARQTIDEAQLKRIERRRAERELRQALARCRHLGGKRASACRRLAQSRSTTNSSGTSLL
jgi:hypothetical protein